MWTPFAVDAAERATKTFVASTVSFALSDWLSRVAVLHFEERAAVWAAGTTACSYAMSFASRRFGRPGTASLTRRVYYDES